MPSTKYKIAEQIQFMLQEQKQASKTKMDDIMELAGQVINNILRVTHFSVTMQDNNQKGRIPDGTMLATYQNLPITSFNGRSKIVLPAVPIQLPRGVGLFQVSPQSNWDCQYIPVPPGQWWMIQKEELISDILGQVGYEWFGTDIVFTKDLTAEAVPVTSAMVRMAIVDISKLSDYDLLPISADIESAVVKEVFTILSGVKIKPDVVDPTSQPIG